MNRPKEKLILFTRYPVPGQVKTRLIPELGNDGAADLQEIMTGMTVLSARSCAAAGNCAVELCYEGGSKKKMRQWLGDGLDYAAQGDGDLGQRMNRAFRRAFQDGFRHVVLIGCDCPDNDSVNLSAAFEALKQNDMVIGPALDGGYYLIGLGSYVAELFSGIPWGHQSVLEETLAVARCNELNIKHLPPFSDVDRPEDVSICQKQGLLAADVQTISVIIPALNESLTIQTVVSEIFNDVLEVIVADGGSRDTTVELAHQAGASVLTVPHGRAAQLNAAALRAQGDVLLFLHADTLLPKPFYRDIFEAVKNPNVAAGAFSLGIDSDQAGIRFVERFANLRSRLLKLPYGDQGLFMSKNILLRSGGFSNMPIMEDYELVQRLQRRGRIVTLDKHVLTSARRWSQLGVMRTSMINQLMVAGYKLGISPERLAGFYRHQKNRHLKSNTQRKATQNESTLLRAK
ncbi:MAG: TIGR04283 family arsenosugar biosynthesis glycosyltransferase [Planctomycetota bacterium]|jgi:rSAM/selenodomain-associated transferase 2/rSAM/selenodomain-associated transferase 1